MSAKLVQRLAGVTALLVLACALTPSPAVKADDGQSVRTQSGKVRCYVLPPGDSRGPHVACQMTQAPGFSQAPMVPQYATKATIASGSADGQVEWIVGNINGSPAAVAQDIVMNYGQTYNINGWTIQPSFDGTRFTNDVTGHGIFVSVDHIYGF